MALTKIDDRGLKTPIDLLDNEKIRFGTDIDLQIYSDNSNAIITAAGAGDLQLTSTADDVIIQAADNIFINPQGGENGLKVYGDGGVKLYYDGSTDPKFETISNGAAVTGSLGVGTTSPLKKLHISDAGDVGIALQTTGANTNKEIWEITCGSNASSEADLVFQSRTDAGSGGIEAMRLASSGKVGIGETSPSTVLHLKSGSNTAATLQTTNNGSSVSSNYNTPNRIFYTGVDIGGVNSAYTIYDGTASAERMRIDSSGRVGIGKTPESAVGSVLQTKGNDGISFQRPGESLSTILRPLSSGLGLRLNYQDGDEILRVDNNGRLLLGTADDGFAGGLTTTIIGNASATNSGVTIASSPSNGTGRIHFADASSGTATYAGYIAYVHSSDSLFFGSGGNGTTALTLDSSQNATFAGNIVVASGKGIDFSATSDATGKTSELLDDYEEGTFTPTQPTVGFNSASGRYTKIGRQVTVSIFCTLPTNSSGVAFYIDSMPFTSSNLSGSYREGGYVMWTEYTSDALKVLIHDNSTRVEVYNGSGGTLQLAGLDNQNFRIQLHYTTD